MDFKLRRYRLERALALRELGQYEEALAEIDTGPDGLLSILEGSIGDDQPGTVDVTQLKAALELACSTTGCDTKSDAPSS